MAKECKCVAYASSGEKTKEGVAVLVLEKIEMWVDVKALINARMQEKKERFLVNKKMKEVNKQKMELDFQSRETHKTGSVKKEPMYHQRL